MDIGMVFSGWIMELYEVTVNHQNFKGTTGSFVKHCFCQKWVLRYQNVKFNSARYSLDWKILATGEIF